MGMRVGVCIGVGVVAVDVSLAARLAVAGSGMDIAGGVIGIAVDWVAVPAVTGAADFCL